MATESGDFSEGKNNHECGRGHLLNKGVWISFDRQLTSCARLAPKSAHSQPCNFTPFMPFYICSIMLCNTYVGNDPELMGLITAVLLCICTFLFTLDFNNWKINKLFTSTLP